MSGSLLPVAEALGIVLRETESLAPRASRGGVPERHDGGTHGEERTTDAAVAGTAHGESAARSERAGPGEVAAHAAGATPETVETQSTEEVSVDDSLGRLLARTVVAPADMPARDRSAMDGYAVRAADLAHVPRVLDVVGFLPAGRSSEAFEVRAGQAVRIMTGAPIPAGADAVQMIERTREMDGGRRVSVMGAVEPGANIFKRGQDLRCGEVLVAAGSIIRPAEIGALAASGHARVLVRRRPLARVLSTGDEVVDAGVDPAPHQVRNSNGPTLIAAMRVAGLAPVSMGIAGDDTARLDARIHEGLSGDLFFVIGGVSVGDRDLVPERLAAAGVEILFHRIAMKPGKPLLFGRRGGCLVFGLPGNPLSAFTGFMVVALPAIQRLLGGQGEGLPAVRATLVGSIEQKPGRTWYRLARLSLRDGRFSATAVESSGSGDLVSAVRANGFIVVPAETAALDEGDEVRALVWPGFDRV